jgi:hypothetical protein
LHSEHPGVNIEISLSIYIWGELMAYSPPFSLPRGGLLFVLLLVGACDGPLPDLSNSSGLASAAPLDAQALELTRADTTFAALVERLSESGGYFDTDNLISNESS